MIYRPRPRSARYTRAVCTLVILRDRVAGHPLVIGANRDERRDRPWTPPRRTGGWIAPRDERAGGTWIGVSDAGVVVAATNWNPAPAPDPTRPSRGELVSLALDAPDAAAALDRVLTRARREAFNGFQLFIGDRTRADVIHAPDGRAAEVDAVPRGFHVVTSRWRLGRFDHEGALDPADLPADTAPADAFATLARVLAVHEDDGPRGPDAICKHRDDRGTLSSAIIAVPAGASAATFLFAAGPPCEAPFEPVGG